MERQDNHHEEDINEKKRESSMLELTAIDDLSSLKRHDLQSLCKKHGIKAAGKSVELIQRLEELRITLLEEGQEDGDRLDESRKSLTSSSPVSFEKEDEMELIQETQLPREDEDTDKVIESPAEDNPRTEHKEDDITISYTSSIAPAAEPLLHRPVELNIDLEDDIKPWGTTPLPVFVNEDASNSHLSYPAAIRETPASANHIETTQQPLNAEAIDDSKNVKKRPGSGSTVLTTKSTVTSKTNTKLPLPRPVKPKIPISRTNLASQVKPNPPSTMPMGQKKTVTSRPASAVSQSTIGSSQATQKVNKAVNEPSQQVNSTMSSATAKPKRPVFDLKASLSRPLGYKPYRGAVKPLSESQKTLKKTVA